MRVSHILALLLSALIILTPTTAVADDGNPYPLFSKLGGHLRTMTRKLNAALFGDAPSPTRKRPVIAAKAVRKERPKAVAKKTFAVAQAQQKMKPAMDAAPENPQPELLPATVPRIQIGSSGAFTAELSGGRKETFISKRAPAVGYWKELYFLVEGDKTLAVSSKPIRFMPARAGTALALPGYVDMNWNNTVNLNWFRGLIEVVYSAKSNQLWAVNELYLEDYLRGIAEAKHDSPTEHLKVMAILARSYAVHHLANGGRHAGEPFHLKNSRNGNGDDQVYRGYLAEARQPRIAQATAGTAGQVVTYRGRPVITPYSSRPSGRTRSPAEAGWNVDWPWVVSVPDPDTAGMTRLGHGVGLSGYGSRKRAERGETAAQILSYYFPGTALGQAPTDGRLVRVSLFSKPLQ